MLLAANVSTRSIPSPPSIESRSALNSWLSMKMMSSPAPPWTVSLPLAIVIWSSPAPPEIESFPVSCPCGLSLGTKSSTSTSRPAPPASVSFPLLPRSVIPASLAIRRSAKVPPWTTSIFENATLSDAPDPPPLTVPTRPSTTAALEPPTNRVSTPPPPSATSLPYAPLKKNSSWLPPPISVSFPPAPTKLMTGALDSFRRTLSAALPVMPGSKPGKGGVPRTVRFSKPSGSTPP